MKLPLLCIEYNVLVYSIQGFYLFHTAHPTWSNLVSLWVLN